MVKEDRELLFQKKEIIDVSIIIPCKNEVNTIKTTINSIVKSKNNLNFEIIVVDDGSTDSSTNFIKQDLAKEIYKDIVLIKTDNLGVAGARNAGAKVAKGDYLFFCDAHVLVPDYWLDKLVGTLKERDVHIVTPCITNMLDTSSVGYGITLNNMFTANWITNKPSKVTEIPSVCGCTFGIVKDTFINIYEFDKFFRGYGSEDFELCLKAWLYGYKVVVNPDITVKHLFKTKRSYKIISSDVIFNMLCLAYYHLKKDRIVKVIDILNNKECFNIAADKIKTNKKLILEQRDKYFSERVYDDDFFFEKFNIPF